MILRIDQASPDPIYLQIRNQIVEGIARGELVAGDSLPSVRALASDLGINLHTVNKAYAVLRDEGYVAMRGRSGAFIARPAAPARRCTPRSPGRGSHRVCGPSPWNTRRQAETSRCSSTRPPARRAASFGRPAPTGQQGAPASRPRRDRRERAAGP